MTQISLDRTQAPAYHSIDRYVLQESLTQRLPNGMPLHTLGAGGLEVVRIEWVINSGNWQEEKYGAANLAARMLTEGTHKYSATQIQEKLAGFGAFQETQASHESSFFTLYCLSKHAPALIELVQELVTESTFPEEEFLTTQRIVAQTLRINQEKTSYLASIALRERLFGKHHPYGREFSTAVVEQLQPQDVRTYFKSNYFSGNAELMVAGKVTPELLQSLEMACGKNAWGNQNANSKKTFHSEPGKKKTTVIEKEGSLQSSIRVGRPMFTLSHPDYHRFTVANEILGGYFGSRLMQNIREDKGFTYGISSNLVAMRQEGYWLIGTDVKREHTRAALDEIYKEIKRMREEPVPETELETVRNYMLGAFVNGITTPFAAADKFKSIYFNGLSYDFYRDHFNQIRSITAEEVMEMAQKYWTPEDLVEVVAGGME